MAQYKAGFLLSWMLALSGICAWSAEPVVPEGLLGCWQDKKHNVLLKLEAARLIEHHPEGLLVVKAGYAPGKILLTMGMGEKSEVAYELKGATLVLTNKSGEKAEPTEFTKLAEPPPELDLSPLEMGKQKPEAAELEKMKKEFRDRIAKDQAVRQKAIAQKGGTQEMQTVDKENTARVLELLKKYGWLDATRFGAEASNAAFLIVQHSGDLRLMITALGEIEKDAKAGRISKDAFALLYDRVKLNLGEKQRYGTQIGMNSKQEMIVAPLEDRKNVDALRKEVGLPPMAQYLQMIKQAYGYKGEVKFPQE